MERNSPAVRKTARKGWIELVALVVLVALVALVNGQRDPGMMTWGTQLLSDLLRRQHRQQLPGPLATAK